MSIITKKCNKCGEVGEFYLRKNGSPQDCCKKCYVSRSAVYQHNNLEKVRENSKKRHERNPEKFNLDRLLWKYKNPDKRKETQKKYYSSHKDEIISKSGEWAKNNRDKRNSYSSNWFDKNPFKSVEYNNKRRATVNNVGGTITDDEWESLIKFYNYTCLCCGRNDVELTLDHVIPVTRGGANVIDNAQPLCRSCNSSKGAKTIDYRK